MERPYEYVLQSEGMPVEQVDCITIDEVRNAIKVVKAGGGCALRQMLQTCNAAYVTEIAPSDWQREVISPLFTKDETSMCENYRRIT